MTFWEIIKAWLNHADDRKVIIHRLKDRTSVDLYWRGQCVRKYTKETILKESKPVKKKKISQKRK